VALMLAGVGRGVDRAAYIGSCGPRILDGLSACVDDSARVDFRAEVWAFLAEVVARADLASAFDAAIPGQATVFDGSTA
jgi:hypothetical protein